MTSKDSGQSEDQELLDRYRRASDTDSSAPSDAVRAAILAEGRRVAAELAKAELEKKEPLRAFDTTRPAANDSRWKFTAFGTLGAALLAALIIAPRYWETLPASKISSSAVPAPAPAENSVNEPAVMAEAARQATAPAPAAPAPGAAVSPAPEPPAPKLESISPSAPRDSVQDVVVTAARRKREDTPVLPSAAPAPLAAPADARTLAQTSAPSPLAAPRAYVPQAEEKALAGASASAADRASARVTNQIVGGLPSSPNLARLNAAADAGDVAQAVALIDKGTDVNARDGQGRTALMIAVSRGRLEVVRLLLQRGADPNLADNGGRTALREALDKNLDDIAAMLRDAGAR